MSRAGRVSPLVMGDLEPPIQQARVDAPMIPFAPADRGALDGRGLCPGMTKTEVALMDSKTWLVEATVPALARWDGFYVIVGSAAGALIGWQFVVMTRIANRPSPRVAEGSSALGTPTVDHFSVTLLLSAVPRWPGITTFGVAVFVIGLCGVGYSASCCGVCTGRPPIVPMPRIGFILPLCRSPDICCLWLQLRQCCSGMTWRCLVSPPRRRFCSSPAFTTRGTRSPTTSLSPAALPARIAFTAP
jgi:hypothetical protein